MFVKAGWAFNFRERVGMLPDHVWFRLIPYRAAYFSVMRSLTRSVLFSNPKPIVMNCLSFVGLAYVAEASS